MGMRDGSMRGAFLFHREDCLLRGLPPPTRAYPGVPSVGSVGYLLLEAIFAGAWPCSAPASRGQMPAGSGACRSPCEMVPFKFSTGLAFPVEHARHRACELKSFRRELRITRPGL